MEEFEFVTSGIESIAVTIALLAGGAWALYKFCELQAKRHAEAQIRESELRQRETEIEIRQREQEANIGSVIEISIRASQQSLPNDSARYISAIVEIENKGKKNTRLEYGKSRTPFSVYAVEIKEDGSLDFRDGAAYSVPVGGSPTASSPSVIVRAGGREKIPFFVRVGSPGLYLLAFAAHLSKEEQAVAKRLGFRLRGRWVAKEYYVVE
jgi:hypothetical protein